MDRETLQHLVWSASRHIEALDKDPVDRLISAYKDLLKVPIDDLPEILRDDFTAIFDRLQVRVFDLEVMKERIQKLQAWEYQDIANMIMVLRIRVRHLFPAIRQPTSMQRNR